MKTHPVFANMSFNPNRHNERGMTIVMVAISIVLLMAMAALAVDVGVLYTARTSAQHAADAAALAGAYTFTLTSQPQPASAQNAAIAVAAKTGVMGKAVTLAPSDVVVDLVNHRVTVTVNRNLGGNPINTFFAGALGISQMGTQARAVAEAATQATGSRCVKPVYISNTALSNKKTFDLACNASPKEVIFDPTTHKLTAWATSVLGTQLITLHPGDPKNALVPSQYYSLDFGDGGATLKCTWGHCLNDPDCKATISVLKCGNTYPVETGNKVGPVKQGVEDLIGKPKPLDQFIAIDQYKNTSTGTVSDTSRALVVAPVWDNCSPPAIVPGTNGQTVTIVGFAKVFVDSVNGGADVKGHLVGAYDCDPTADSSTSTGPLGVPIRLVQVPAS